MEYTSLFVISLAFSLALVNDADKIRLQKKHDWLSIITEKNLVIQKFTPFSFFLLILFFIYLSIIFQKHKKRTGIILFLVNMITFS